MEKMEKMQANFIDCIVTDPPYGLEFMQAKWDSPAELMRSLDDNKK